MIKKYLKWVVFGGLFLIPFVPFLVDSSLFFPFITTKAFAWRTIVEIIFGAWVILALFEPEYRPKKSIILYSLLSFMLIIGVADIFGVAPLKSFWSNYERMEGYITILHLGAFFIVISSVFKDKEWKAWWNTSLAASFLMVLYCFMQLAGVFEIHQGGVRVDGALGNAAYLAVYLLFHIFFALILYMRENRGSFMKWIYGILVFLQAVILYYTATRGAILGLLGGLLIVGILNFRNAEQKGVQKISRIGITLFVVLTVVFLLARNTDFVKNSAVLSRFSEISTSQIKTEGRSFIWPMAVKGVMEKPILGWGQDNFNYVFNEHYDPAMYRLEPWFDRAHNIFLDWAIAGGILGLLAYLFLYVALLVSIWKHDKDFSYLDRSIITGLISAYFFHNLFVFDHLISYILFISILAYVHSRTGTQNEVIKVIDNKKIIAFVSPVAVIGLIFVLYTVNLKPYIGNQSLIKALQAVQGNTESQQKTLGFFKTAYNNSRLGRPEVVEWLVTNAQPILSSNISTSDKNDYFTFSKEAINKQLEELPTDARYQIFAGTFFSKTGFPDEALKHLNIAKTLIPGKQAVYIELGSAYLNKGDATSALQSFKQAYELAPGYTTGQIVYLIGAIYAGDSGVVNQMSSIIPESTLVTDDRITSALMNTKNYNALVQLLRRRIDLKPTDPQGYIGLSATYIKMGDKNSAIGVLRNLEATIPSSTDQAEQYIKGIEDGTLK